MTTNPTIVITGANRGIGLSLTNQYLELDCDVYAVCRTASPALKQSSTTSGGLTIIEGIDVSSASGVTTLANALQSARIDILINNAGVLQNEVLGTIDYDSILKQFHTNALGPLRVTEALVSNLLDGAKVMMVTSRMGSIADNTSGGRYGYRMSKAALNIAAVSLAHDLAHRGIAVGIVHPGLVGTDMISGYGDITPDQAAERIAARIENLSMQNTGTFWHSNGEELPW